MDDRMENKLDKISEDVSDIKVILARQEVSLQVHIKRSDTLEKHVELLEGEFKEVQKRHLRFDGILKLISVMAMIATIFKAVEFFIK